MATVGPLFFLEKLFPVGVFWLPILRLAFDFLLDLHVMQLLDQVRQVEVGLQLTEVLHDGPYFLLVVMVGFILLLQLLLAVSLCKGFGATVRGHSFPLVHSSLNHLVQFLVLHGSFERK